MSWKQTLFLGGAVLLLAACTDATAPTPQLRDGNVAAEAKSPGGAKLPKPTTLECRGSFTVSSGRVECGEF